MNINRIFILGDSFSANGSSFLINESEKHAFWVDMLTDTFNIKKYAEESRDIQTILDIWIKLLPQITENDCIVVGFPFFSRWRLPRHKDDYKQENELIIRHIGQHAYSECKIETVERNGINERLSENEIINSSIASTLNTKEIIESLTQLSKCKVILWSWVRFKEGFKPNGLYDKTDLENELGYWGTQDDIYYKTKKKYGRIGDLHWDETTQKLFFEFIKNKIEQ